MNRKAAMGRALTILMSAGIIALFFFIFIFVIEIGTPGKAMGISENLNGLSRESQLRSIIGHSADDLAQAKPGSVPEMVKETFGKDAKFALYINNAIVSGAKVGKVTAAINTMLPNYEGSTVSVRLEVGS